MNSSEKSVADNKTILIISEAKSRNAVSVFFRKNKYHVHVVKDSESAMEIIEQIKPDLIFLGIKLPGIDGFELFKKIKKQEKTSDIPVVFLLSETEKEFRIKCFQLGATDCWNEPYSSKEYLTKAEKFINDFQNLSQLKHTKEEIANKLEETREKLDHETKEHTRAVIGIMENQRVYDRLIKSWKDFIFLTDLDFNFVLVNEELSKATGLSNEEMYGKPVTSILNQESRQVVLDHYKDLLQDNAEENKAHIDLVEILNIDGSKTPVELLIMMVLNIYTNIKGIMGLGRNFSERKQAKDFLDAAFEKRKELEFIINHSPAIVWLWKAEPGWPVEYVSDNVSIFGYTSEDFLSGTIPYSSIIHSGDVARVGAEVTKFTQENRSDFTQEYRILTKNGEVRWVDDRTWIRHAPDGTITHYQGIIVDITERKLIEERLSRSETNYQNVMDNLQDIFYRSDVKGNLILASSSLLKVLGYDSLEECIGKPISTTFFFEQDKWSKMLSIIKENGKATDFEVMLKKKDGTPVYIESNSHGYFDASGHFAGIEGIMRDITNRKLAEEERRKLESQLIHSQKMEAIGTLAGGIAHDFNNILGAIIGCTELSLIYSQDQPELHKGLEDILDAADRAKDLVKRIMLFGRKTEFEKRPTSMNYIIEEVIKLLRAFLPATIEIEKKLEAKKDLIMADPTQMHQVLVNLCTNAGHAMRENGGILTIGLKNLSIDDDDSLKHGQLKSGDYLEISVADTGCGIPFEYIDKIFDPYFTTKNKGDGTGLGLSIANGIIKNHGGEIKVYSELGEGSLFRIYIPLMEDNYSIEEKASVAAIKKSKKLLGGNEKILFLDDEPMLAEAGKRQLEFMGYTVVTETNPQKALELLKNNNLEFDLIITDKTMPIMTGYDFAREAWKIRPGIPIILCTGFINKDDQEKIKSLGIKQCIAKPIRMTELSEIVRMALTK